MRGQIVFWDMQAKMGHFSAVGVAGVIEAPSGAIPEDVVFGLSLVAGHTGAVLSMTGYWRDVCEVTRNGSIHNALCEPIWPHARSETKPSGGFLARRTRMPAPDGMEVYAFSGVVQADPGELKCRHRYDLDVALIVGVGEDQPPLLGQMAALRPSPMPLPVADVFGRIHQKPVWGFGPKPVGIYSTLRLDVIDAIRRHDQIRRKAFLSDADRDFMRQIQGDPAISAILVEREASPEVVSFNEQWLERFGVEDWGMVLTLEDCRARDTAAREILAGMQANAPAPALRN